VFPGTFQRTLSRKRQAIILPRVAGAGMGRYCANATFTRWKGHCMEILSTLGELIVNLARLASELFALAWHYILFIVWVAWWLWGVNWNRTWPFLRQGAWAPLVLLTIVSALVWSRIAPGPRDCLALITVPNFWWQLGYVGMLVAIALFCGWLQGVLQWAPAEVDLEPPAHAHDHDHADDHSHSHGDHGHSHSHGHH
jgi:hypothetical protein